MFRLGSWVLLVIHLFYLIFIFVILRSKIQINFKFQFSHYICWSQGVYPVIHCLKSILHFHYGNYHCFQMCLTLPCNFFALMGADFYIRKYFASSKLRSISGSSFKSRFLLLLIFWQAVVFICFAVQVVLLFSCILAFFLNYSIFLNTTLNSAVTQTICGNVKVCSLASCFAINMWCISVLFHGVIIVPITALTFARTM